MTGTPYMIGYCVQQHFRQRDKKGDRVAIAHKITFMDVFACQIVYNLVAFHPPVRLGNWMPILANGSNARIDTMFCIITQPNRETWDRF